MSDKTCKTCQHWAASDRTCCNGMFIVSFDPDAAADGDRLVFRYEAPRFDLARIPWSTGPSFGCVHHEAKPEEPRP